MWEIGYGSVTWRDASTYWTLAWGMDQGFVSSRIRISPSTTTGVDGSSALHGYDDHWLRSNFENDKNESSRTEMYLGALQIKAVWVVCSAAAQDAGCWACLDQTTSKCVSCSTGYHRLKIGFDLTCVSNKGMWESTPAVAASDDAGDTPALWSACTCEHGTPISATDCNAYSAGKQCFACTGLGRKLSNGADCSWCATDQGFTYNNVTDACECASGYVLDAATKKCITIGRSEEDESPTTTAPRTTSSPPITTSTSTSTATAEDNTRLYLAVGGVVVLLLVLAVAGGGYLMSKRRVAQDDTEFQEPDSP